MKIRAIRAAGLRGVTPAGGWTNELRPDDCVHTLVAVHTDEGLTGIAASRDAGLTGRAVSGMREGLAAVTRNWRTPRDEA